MAQGIKNEDIFYVSSVPTLKCFGKRWSIVAMDSKTEYTNRVHWLGIRICISDINGNNEIEGSFLAVFRV